MEHLREANALFTRASDERGISATLDDMGKVHWLRGAYGQALEFHRQALSIRRAIGDQRSIALSLANIGRVHHDSGGFKAAIAQFHEALELRRSISDRLGVVQSLCDLGGVYVEDGNFDVGLEMFSEAYQIAIEIGDKLAQADVLARLGECKSAMLRNDEAVGHLTMAIQLATDLGSRSTLAGCCRRLAEVYLTTGDVEQAFDQAQRACTSASRWARGSISATPIASSPRWSPPAAPPPSSTPRPRIIFNHAVEILAGMKNELELARVYRAFAAYRDRIGRPEDANALRRHAEEIYARLRRAPRPPTTDRPESSPGDHLGRPRGYTRQAMTKRGPDCANL